MIGVDEIGGASSRAREAEVGMTTVPAWRGLITDHLIEACPHRARSRPTLERHGWWQPTWQVDPYGIDLCGWCVRVWKARNRKATK